MSGLNHTACNHAVYASQPGSPLHHARLASGWLPTLTGWDWLPIGLQRWFQSFNTFIPHLQAFLAHRRFKLRPGPNPTTLLSQPFTQPSTHEPTSLQPSHSARNPAHQPDRSPTATTYPSLPHRITHQTNPAHFQAAHAPAPTP